MVGVLQVVAVLATWAAVIGGLWALAARVRRTGVGTGMLGPFEEMWHPVAVDSRVEVQAADYRPAEAPAAGDPPLLTAGRRVNPDPARGARADAAAPGQAWANESGGPARRARRG